jgi:hypothetical protein
MKRMFAFSRRMARETLGIAEREGAARFGCPGAVSMSGKAANDLFAQGIV